MMVLLDRNGGGCTHSDMLSLGCVHTLSRQKKLVSDGTLAAESLSIGDLPTSPHDTRHAHCRCRPPTNRLILAARGSGAARPLTRISPKGRSAACHQQRSQKWHRARSIEAVNATRQHSGGGERGGAVRLIEDQAGFHSCRN